MGKWRDAHWLQLLVNSLSVFCTSVIQMKLQIYSDLHNEFSVFTPPTSDADLVILAGDIDTQIRGVKWANETFA